MISEEQRILQYLGEELERIYKLDIAGIRLPLKYNDCLMFWISNNTVIGIFIKNDEIIVVAEIRYDPKKAFSLSRSKEATFSLSDPDCFGKTIKFIQGFKE